MKNRLLSLAISGAITTLFVVSMLGNAVHSSAIHADSVYARGAMIDLGTLGGPFSSALDINDLGQVVGHSDTSPDPNVIRGFLVNPQDTDGDGKPDLWYCDANPTDGRNDLMQDIGTLGGYASEAAAINEVAQQVAGTSATSSGARAFLLTPEDTNGDGVPDLWNRDTDGDGANDLMMNLGTLGGETSMGFDVNNMGMVVGTSKTSSGDSHAFVWRLGAGEALSPIEYQVTTAPAYENQPRLGNDGVSNLVTFFSRVLIPGDGLDQGDIWYQRLDDDGAPMGAPVQVTSDPTNDEFNDISGDYIVYTEYASVNSVNGRIRLYQISTGAVYVLGSDVCIGETRIHGDKVVWLENLWTTGEGWTGKVMLYDLDWLGTDTTPVVLAGPSPPAFSVDIGDRFVVWTENAFSQYDVVAYDLVTGARVQVTDTLELHENEPSTNGPWIVWTEQPIGIPHAPVRIVARNMDSGEERVVVDNGARNWEPSIDGNMIAYESDINGNLDVFVYKLDEGKTFQVTTDPNDQYYTDIFGGQVGYLDRRYGNDDIFVSSLIFAPDYGMEDLGTLGGRSSEAKAINDLGNVVGSASTEAGEEHAFLIKPIDTDGDGVPDLWNCDVNNDGVNDLMQDLGTLGGPSSIANDVNNALQVVGISHATSGERHAFVWENSVMNDIGTLGGTFSQALDNNDLGEIVGSSLTAAAVAHPFLFSNGVITDLGFAGVACGINNLEQIVGMNALPHAFFWQQVTPPPQEQIKELVTQIQNLCDSGALPKGLANAFIAKLSAGMQYLEDGNLADALGVLHALLNQLNALTGNGRIQEEVGQLLIDAVTKLIAQISGP